MSIKSAGKLAYLIPSQRFEFDASVIYISELLKLLCVGCVTGEVLVYRYSTAKSFSLTPRFILIPDPRQKSGVVEDIVLCEFPYEEVTVTLFNTNSAQAAEYLSHFIKTIEYALGTLLMVNVCVSLYLGCFQ